MEVKLLPCPFCGGKPAWGEGVQKIEYGNEQVYCTNCCAITAPEGNKEEAAAWWNARTSEPLHQSGDGAFVKSISDDLAALAATTKGE